MLRQWQYKAVMMLKTKFHVEHRTPCLHKTYGIALVQDGLEYSLIQVELLLYSFSLISMCTMYECLDCEYEEDSRGELAVTNTETFNKRFPKTSFITQK